MIKKQERSDGRLHDQLRPIVISLDVFSNAPTAVLLQIGNTSVLCAITLQQQVPSFLKGSKKGWLTAEYAMLPTATLSRVARSLDKMNGRSVEISRLIGRSLRTMIDFSKLGERTIIVDCDVLKADGGTRTACITAASLALQIAVQRWMVSKELRENIITDPVAAISVGMVRGLATLDLNYDEDCAVIADYNFVLSKKGSVVEVQGSTENGSMSWENFDEMKNYACKGVVELFSYMNKYVNSSDQSLSSVVKQKKQFPFLSLASHLSPDKGI